MTIQARIGDTILMTTYSKIFYTILLHVFISKQFFQLNTFKSVSLKRPLVDPGIINEFATAAFRFGHSMINGMFKLVSQRRNNREKDVYWLWRLREVFDGQGSENCSVNL